MATIIFLAENRPIMVARTVDSAGTVSRRRSTRSANPPNTSTTLMTASIAPPSPMDWRTPAIEEPMSVRATIISSETIPRRSPRESIKPPGPFRASQNFSKSMLSNIFGPCLTIIAIAPVSPDRLILPRRIHSSILSLPEGDSIHSVHLSVASVRLSTTQSPRGFRALKKVPRNFQVLRRARPHCSAAT